jgi:hypothetical protein
MSIENYLDAVGQNVGEKIIKSTKELRMAGINA